MTGHRIGGPVAELTSAQSGSVRELLQRAETADGVAPVSEQGVLSLNAPGTAQHLLVTGPDGTLLGYANLAPAHGAHPPMAEAVVDPQARNRRIGTDLVRATLSAGGPGARVWAHGDLPAAAAVTARLGLGTVRELWQMRRSLDGPGLPELGVPAGTILRTYAGPGDDAELLRVNNAAFDWHPEQGGWTGRDLEARRAADWFDPAGLFLAFDEADPDRLLGFHWTKVEPGSDAGEVYVVGIDPAAQGRGLGRLLTLAGLHHLQRAGLRAVLLYTEGDNRAAVHTYTRLGFTPAHIDRALAVVEH